MKRMACVIALATGTGLAVGTAPQPALAEPTPATAATGLKINLVSPGTVTNDSPFGLDVNFRGGSIRSIEMFVDNQRIAKRKLKTAKFGVIHLELDEMAEGTHEIRIEAVDQDGNTATSTMMLHVVPGDLNDSVRVLSPKRNTMVKEIVPFEIKLDSSVREPYVSFFLDNAFLAMTNYAPFIYNWDSTKVANGPHTFSVEVIDGTTYATVKKINMQVIVNNPGGHTNRQAKTPDLGSMNALPGVPGVLSEAMASDPTPRHPDLLTEDLRISHSNHSTRAYSGLRFGDAAKTANTAGARPTAYPVGPLVAENRGNGLIAPDALLPRDTRGIREDNHLANPDHLPTAQPHRQGAVLPGMLGLLAEPMHVKTPGDLSILGGRLADRVTRPRRAGNIAARPRMDLNGAESDEGSQAPAAPSVSRPPAHRHMKTFDVAFDNTRIAFDVPPRVENGLPLAPFRAIFEHSGGVVTWFNQSKMVRAVNSDREIEIKIGNRDAKVNNQDVTMEATPYIDRGRTIVPLSFVRDAMNVKVQYDAKTGHIRIESK
jgi:hypothetical protein